MREEEPTEEILRKEITDMKLLLEEFKKEWKNMILKKKNLGMKDWRLLSRNTIKKCPFFCQKSKILIQIRKL